MLKHIIIFLLLVFNFASIFNIRSKLAIIKEMEKSYFIMCQKEKILESVLNNSFSFQDNYLDFSATSFEKFVLTNSENYTPILFIKVPICNTCIDVLLLEMEKLTSLKRIANLSVLIVSKTDQENNRFFNNIFENQGYNVFQTDVSEINNENIKEFPSISFIVIDKRMKILSFCEFSEYNPAIFSSAVDRIISNLLK